MKLPNQKSPNNWVTFANKIFEKAQSGHTDSSKPLFYVFLIKRVILSIQQQMSFLQFIDNFLQHQFLKYVQPTGAAQLRFKPSAAGLMRPPVELLFL